MTACRHRHQLDPPSMYRRSMVHCRWIVSFSLFMLFCVRVKGFIHKNNPALPFRRFCITSVVDDRIGRTSQPRSSVSSLLYGIPMRSPALYSGITGCCYRYNNNNNNNKSYLTRLHDKLNNNNEEYASTAAADNNDDDELLVDDEEEVLQLVADFRGRPAGVVIEDLNWRVHKLRLEEANTRRFLKAGPRFLPYEECRKWVQAWGNRWQSATEW
jgi:hypothetical protein